MFKMRWIIIGVMLLGFSVEGYSQVPEVLKEFLENHNFLDLIQKHKQEKITLRIAAKQDSNKQAKPKKLSLAETPVNSKASVKRNLISLDKRITPFFYTIQVFATHDFLKAKRLKESLEKTINHPVTIFQQQSLWKILIGKFAKRNSAERVLKGIRKSRFKDAWITQIASF